VSSLPSDGLAATNGVHPPVDTIELTVPELGDLGERAVVERWLKRIGDRVAVDEPLCRLSVGELEFEVCSTADGELTRIFAEEGVGVMETGSLAEVQADGPAVAEERGADAFAEPATAAPAAPFAEPAAAEPAAAKPVAAEPEESETRPAARIESIEFEPIDAEFSPADEGGDPGPAGAPSVAPSPVADRAPVAELPPGAAERLPTGEDVDWSRWISPVVQMLAEEHGVDLTQVRGTGIGGRVRKRDVLAHVEARRRSDGA
jgi:pyruvate dehydrogenase E2 component (dihydrolipoamide acetyltransferase)